MLKSLSTRHERSVRNSYLMRGAREINKISLKKSMQEKLPTAVINQMKTETTFDDLKSVRDPERSIEVTIWSFYLRKFDLFPEFMQITEIFRCADDKILLIAREFLTKGLNRDLFSYELKKTNRYCKLDLKNLIYDIRGKVYKKMETIFVHKTVNYGIYCN